MRGQVFEIDGKRIFTFGDGNSIDKQWRIECTNRRRDDTRANKKL